MANFKPVLRCIYPPLPYPLQFPSLNTFDSGFLRVQCPRLSSLPYQHPERMTLISTGLGQISSKISSSKICSDAKSCLHDVPVFLPLNHICRKLSSGIAFCSRSCRQQFFPFLFLLLLFSLLLSIISYMLVLFLLPSASLLSVLLVLMLGLVLGPGLWMSASMVVLPINNQTYKCQKLHY